MRVKTITYAEAEEIIKFCYPKGLYLFQKGEKWGALDNSTGDAWTRIFDTQDEARRWVMML